MSGPFAPAQNRQPRILPMGQTNKPGGAERVPQGQGAPSVNPGVARTQAAQRMGIPPAKVGMQPGYTPPPTRSITPQMSPPQDMPPVMAGSVPMPRPRPQMFEDRFNQETGDVRTAQMPMAQAIINRMKKGGPEASIPYGRPGTMEAPTSFPKAGQPYDPTTGNATGAPPDRAALLEQAKKTLASQMAAQQMAQAGQGPRDVPKGAPSEQTVTSPPRAGTPSGVAAQPAAAPNGTPPGSRFVPSQASGVYYEKDPEAEVDKKGKPKDKKLKVNKEGKGHNAYYYEVLGVDPSEGKAAADQALRKLIARAKSNPETITRDEDRILASAGKDPTFNKSMEEDAVRQRFEERSNPKADRETPGETKIQKKLPDRAAGMVTQMIDQAATPAWIGRGMPTQEDVNAGKQTPQQFQKQFPQYAPPQPAAPDIQDTEVAEEEGD
jgi:hypothetical protein